MMQLPTPVFKDIVLVGGGHANVHIIKMFGMNPQPGIRVTLITTVVAVPYSGMMPGYVAGVYTRDQVHVDMSKLCTFGGARLIMAEVCHIDAHRKEITCTDGRPPIRYDVVSINVGISPQISLMNPNEIESLTPVKPIVGFANRWDIIMQRVLTDGSSSKKQIVIVGGGAGGVELSFAMNHRLKTELAAIGKDPNTVEIALLTRGSTILAEHNSNVQQAALRLMKEKGIKTILNAEAKSIGGADGNHHILCSDGTAVEFFEAIWCTQAAAPAWLKTCVGIDLVGGFVAVRPTLQSTSAPDVFAVGDVNHMVDNPRPKAGVFAVRAGPPLLDNMKRLLYGQPLVDWLPQDQFLSIIGVAPNYAFASRGPMCVEGEFIWRLKDRIDRDWLGGYNDLVPMSMQPPPSDPDSDATRRAAEQGVLMRQLSPEVQQVLSQQSMRCGGCGSKVGAQVLTRALRRLSTRLRSGIRSEVVSGVGGVTPGDDAALIRAPEPPAYLVQTIDYFRSFVKDPYLFGQIAAIHSLSDIFAMNAEPISAMALCVLPYGPEDKVEDTLVQMLGGAVKVLTDEKCTLVGGHTAEGAEDALGLSCQGVVHPDKVLPKGPIAANCSLIITKPIGTGVIMAGDMKCLVRGEDVNSALNGMLISNRKAAQILFENGCKSCTDVTGFGVLGHLLEMIKYDDVALSLGTSTAASVVGVKLHLDSIPLLSGAADCVKNGVFSTLQPQNMRSGRAVSNPEFGASHPAYQLLFDPQTSGGLLACVSDDVADTVIAQLKDAGYHHAAVIGHFFDSPRTAESGADSKGPYKISLPIPDDQIGSCPVDESEILVWLD